TAHLAVVARASCLGWTTRWRAAWPKALDRHRPSPPGHDRSRHAGPYSGSMIGPVQFRIAAAHRGFPGLCSPPCAASARYPGRTTMTTMTRSTAVARTRRRVSLAAFLAVLWALAPAASAQDDAMTAIDIPDQPDAIALDTGTLPDARQQEAWHRQYGSVFARNVTDATLTPFLPDPAKATGAAVIVAPGGGFRSLSMENEGWDVARALADRGVAAFVLKYRLNQTPADLDGFAQS